MSVTTTSRLVISLALGTTLILTLLIAPAPTRADTKDELAAAQERLAELHSQANAAYQQVYKAEEDLAAVTTQLDQLREELDRATRDVQESRRQVGRVARASYINGGMESSLFLLLSSDPAEFNAQYESLRRVEAATTHTLDLQREREARLAETEASAAEQQRRAEELREEKSAALATVQARVAEAERIEADLAQRYAAEIAAEQEQQRRESSAAALAAQQARGYDGGSTAGGSGGSTGPGASGPTTGTGIDPVLEFALAQVGKGYVLGASGPDRYDCSGFVLAAYAQAGISLPHYTRYQAARTRPVSLSQAQPGDLFFYFELGASHVAIYLGDGRMVHAANPRRGVVVGSINESWYAQRLTMVGRVIG